MIHATVLSRVDEDVCIKIQPKNHRHLYLCDCGVASDLTIKDARDTAALFISHTHIDHFINFDGILRHQLAIGRPVVICGPRGMARHVSCKLNAYRWNLSFDEHAVWYEVREVDPEGGADCFALRVPQWEPEPMGRLEGDFIYEDGAVQVRAGVLDHGTDSVAWRFQEPSRVKVGALPHKPGPWVSQLKAAFEAQEPERLLEVHGQAVRAGDLFGCVRWQQGYSVGVVMDHLGGPENHARIASLMHQVDHLLIECYYSQEDHELARLNHHSTAALSGTAARMAQARRATPCHFSRRYNARVEELRQQFKAHYEG
jgi:ribonuclease Z